MCDSKHPNISLIHPIMEMPKQQIAIKDSDSGLVNFVKNTILNDSNNVIRLKISVITVKKE